MADNIEIEVTDREAKLILEYGYPFADQAKIFEPLSEIEGVHLVKIEKYWLELIIGDLCRSIRQLESTALQEELDCLCDSLELAIKPRSTRSFQ